MAIRRALVVDDSKSARIFLKGMLEEQGLQVDVAESGEHALDFLKKDKVDVVFMDHTMPGMDGLEAVALLKANPDTAMIPVMMYTTKEGEVYVGQARALGAVGVMPKNVQKHQVFEMLLKLGLVQDRRIPPGDQPHESEATTPESDAVDITLDQQAMGISVQSLVTRILQDQHMTLRSDILRSQKVFAKEVAREVIKEHLTILEVDDDAEPEVEVPVRSSSGRSLLTAVLVAALAVGGFLAYQFKTQRDAAVAQIQNLRSTTRFQQVEQSGVTEASLARMQNEGDELRQTALSTVQWSINEGNFVDMRGAAFSPQLADKIITFIPYLRSLGFQGEVRLTSHLGRFCMNTSVTGDYQLAAPDTTVIDCEYVGHPQDRSSFVSDRLSLAFSDLLLEDPAPGIRLRLVALDEGASQAGITYPSSDVSSGEWNTVALLNNRVHIELIADSIASP